jgi:4-azaleucine resistance transporter AzlC
VLLYGMMFGVLAAAAQLSPLQAWLMSALVYSGSAQMAALQGWSAEGASQAGAAILPVVLTILIMNARYLLYGAALRPWLGSLDPARAYLTLYFVGDGNWALAMKERESGGGDDVGFLLGSGLIMFAAWTSGTLAGHLLGSLVTRPDLLGLDFLLVAFSAAFMMELYRGRHDLAPALMAVLVALLLSSFVGAGWIIVAAGLAAAITAYLRHDA